MKVKRTFEAKRGLPFGAVLSGVDADTYHKRYF